MRVFLYCFELILIVSTFGTTVNGVFNGVNPIGGENNWFCIFEADWGCMVTDLKVSVYI